MVACIWRFEREIQFFKRIFFCIGYKILGFLYKINDPVQKSGRNTIIPYNDMRPTAFEYVAWHCNDIRSYIFYHVDDFFIHEAMNIGYDDNFFSDRSLDYIYCFF